MRKNQILSATIIWLLFLSIFAIILPQVTAAPTPEIRVTTTTDKNSAQAGDIVTYTFEVTNTGKVTLFNVQVGNDLVGSAINKQKVEIELMTNWSPEKLDLHRHLHSLGDYTDPLMNTATATASTRKGETYSATDIHNVYLYGQRRCAS